MRPPLPPIVTTNLGDGKLPTSDMMFPMQIALALFDRFTALDILGPYQVLSQLPGAQVVFVADKPGPVNDDTVLTVQAHASFDDIRSPDIVVVGGGIITRKMARDGHPVIDWLAAVDPISHYTTSVCTGSILLGAAGLLKGKQATSHWMALDQLSAFGAAPTSQRVVEQGKVITAAGVSSGIDMALTLVAHLAGAEVAQAIQLGIEYDPQPPFNAGSPDTAPAEIVELLRAVMVDSEARTLG